MLAGSQVLVWRCQARGWLCWPYNCWFCAHEVSLYSAYRSVSASPGTVKVS